MLHSFVRGSAEIINERFGVLLLIFRRLPRLLSILVERPPRITLTRPLAVGVRMGAMGVTAFAASPLEEPLKRGKKMDVGACRIAVGRGADIIAAGRVPELPDWVVDRRFEVGESPHVLRLISMRITCQTW